MILVYYYVIGSVITFAKIFLFFIYQANNVISYYIIGQKLLHYRVRTFITLLAYYIFKMVNLLRNRPLLCYWLPQG